MLVRALLPCYIQLVTWDAFLQATAKRFIRPLLKEALPYVKAQGIALDLGAGAMNDAAFLVQSGFSVVAVDSNPGVEKFALEIPNVELVISSYEDFDFPSEKYDLVNAQYALPFNPPATFNDVFSKLLGSLKKGGIFVGQFFGTEDDWSSTPTMTFHSEAEVRKLLAPLTIHVFREEKKLGKTATGPEKFWHVFNVIAEKP